METRKHEIPLDEEMLARVGSWRSQQPDPQSLAEALQRLIDVGLTVSSKGRGRFSEGEKLILWALRDVWRHQPPRGRLCVLPASGDSSLEFLACAPPFLALLNAYPAMADARRGG